jgi:hypothetical protein
MTMLNDWKPDLVIGFGVTKGTNDMLTRAKERGVQIEQFVPLNQ